MTENIDLTNSDQYILTIRVSTDGFSFSFYHTVDKHFYHQTYKVDPSITIIANLRNIFKENKFVEKNIRRLLLYLITHLRLLYLLNFLMKNRLI